VSTCPDCGLSLGEPKGDLQSKAPRVCPLCLDNSVPEPQEGWPIFAKWISSTRGRGVFARFGILKGDTVERCWVMPLSEEESAQSLQMPVLNRYLFPWIGSQRALVGGCGLLYNYDRMEVTKRDPNLECILRQGISAIEFRALRDIREGEELTWDYQRARLKSR
jgi:hypothetical protein